VIKRKDNLWTEGERRVLRRLTTPLAIQEYLDGLPYSGEKIYRCPRSVLRDRRAHCFDGAVFAAAVLCEIGHPPLILELIPNRRDDDHIIAPFRAGALWGAVSKSNFALLRYREPVYPTLRALVLSYFEGFFNLARERTLRAFGAPLPLARFDRAGWRFADSTMYAIARGLDRSRRTKLVTPAMAGRLTLVDRRLFQAGTLGLDWSGVYRPKKKR
jgi:hypothetical protein